MDYPNLIDWLLNSGEPWVVYNTLVDLTGEPPDSAAVRAAYRAMQSHPRIIALIDVLDTWPQPLPLKRAYDPKDSLWKLQTLADFGLRRDDDRIAAIAERVFAAQAENGGFLQGGFDHTHSWDTRPYICISHVMTYALARFGYVGWPQEDPSTASNLFAANGEDIRLKRAYNQILDWQRLDGGWHPNQQNLPGKKGEAEFSCPFGTQNVLRALVAHPVFRGSNAAHRAAKYLLDCWGRRAEPFRPVGFGIGTDWDRVTYPFVQYGLLKSVDTLSQIPGVAADLRFQEMLDEVERKRCLEGAWKAESASKAWSDFEFGQKKAPSAWITFLVLRAFKRVGKRIK